MNADFEPGPWGQNDLDWGTTFDKRNLASMTKRMGTKLESILRSEETFGRRILDTINPCEKEKGTTIP